MLGFLAPQTRPGADRQPDEQMERQLPRPDPAQAQADEKPESQSPPGQFVSDDLQADCSRFLDEVKEFIRHRSEAGLGRER